MRGVAAFVLGGMLTGTAWGPQPRGMQQRAVEYLVADSTLRPGYLQLSVRDARSGAGVRYALVCLGTVPPDWIVTDPEGGVRVGKLPESPITVRVMAPGFAEESVTLHPGERARQSALVRLKAGAESTAQLSCTR